MLVLATQVPAWLRVGRVSVLYWDGDATLAAALAEAADAAGTWPGIAAPAPERVRLVLAREVERFDSLTGGRLPEWGVGAAFPATNTIVLRVTGDVRRVLRHELAHLALHTRVERAPLWFDEGYAVRAAGEWDRLDALRVNWALVRGDLPTLQELDRYLQGPQAGPAEAAYALAATAVLLLERMGGERGLAPILAAAAAERDFDRALRRAHRVTLAQFEALWRRDVRHRYGWVLLATSVSVFWAVMGVLLATLWWWRHRRDRERRAALDADAPGSLDAPGTSG